MTYKEITELLPKYDIVELCYALSVSDEELEKSLKEKGYDNYFAFFIKNNFDFENIEIVEKREYESGGLSKGWTVYLIIHFFSEDIYVRVGFDSYWNNISNKLVKVNSKFETVPDITQVYPKEIVKTIYTTEQ